MLQPVHLAQSDEMILGPESSVLPIFDIFFSYFVNHVE